MQNKISKKIEQWYRENKRDLPFRKSNDPYAIWVSEIMAQQTRIDTMIPYYETWMKKWPTIQSLAQADLQEVLHVWQGLGYYNRARKLVEGAVQIMEKYQGVFPEKFEDIQSIAGIGDYTAGAIASIAFNQGTPAVDGNVFRVVTRLTMMKDDITKVSTRKKVVELCKEWMKESCPSDLTQGIMELGAIVCTPKAPQCELCPIQKHCQSFKLGKQLEFPLKKKKQPPKEINYRMYILTYKDWICISYDDQDGLMKGYIRCPQFTKEYDLKGKIIDQGSVKHVFSHRIWNIDWKWIECKKKEDLPFCTWKKIQEVQLVSFVTAHRKIIKKLNIVDESLQ